MPSTGKEKKLKIVHTDFKNGIYNIANKFSTDEFRLRDRRTAPLDTRIDIGEIGMSTQSIRITTEWRSKRRARLYKILSNRAVTLKGREAIFGLSSSLAPIRIISVRRRHQVTADYPQYSPYTESISLLRDPSLSLNYFNSSVSSFCKTSCFAQDLCHARYERFAIPALPGTRQRP